MEETLHLILHEIKGLKKDMTDLKQDNAILKKDVSELKQDNAILKKDVSELNHGQANIETKVDRLETKVDRLETKVDRLTSELRSNFKYTNDKLDDHRKVFGVVSDELKGLKIDVEFLSSKSGIHDMDINNIKNKLKG